MASPYYFDKRTADAAVEFFPRFLRLTTGEWAGKPFYLSEWQAHHTRQIFGWRRRTNGTRRYRKVRGWISKKSGKTEWFAGIGHLLTVADNEPTAEVFSHARNLDQASIVWNRAKAMIEMDRAAQGGAPRPGTLSDLYEVSTTSLFCPHLMSAFKPISGDPHGKHGPSIHGALGDEAWEWKDGALHQHLMDGMSARRQPFDATFSSAGMIKTYGHQLYSETLAMMADPSIDPETYGFAYGGTEQDDWTSPKNWAKWNPNFPLTPKLEFLQAACREAQRNPRLENVFKQFYCGIWTTQMTKWLAMHLWPTLTRDQNDPKLWQKLEKEMAGRVAFGGLDLGSTEDITALVYAFEPKKPGGRVTLLCRAWCPETRIAERDSVLTPYKKWVAMGALTPTPGNVTDYDFIEAQIKLDAEKFRLLRDSKDDYSILVDRYNATQVSVNLRKAGIPVALYGQGFASMAAPTKEFERLFMSRQFEHGNHPVFNWMCGNAAVARNPVGDLKPDKASAAEKIDLVVAAVMAVGLMRRGKSEMDIDSFLANPVRIGAPS